MNQSADNSQLIQPQNKRFKRSMFRLLQRIGRHNATPLMSSTNVLTAEDHPVLLTGQEGLDSATTETGGSHTQHRLEVSVDGQEGLDSATANIGTPGSHTQTRVRNASYRHDLETASAEDCGSELAIRARGFTDNRIRVNNGVNNIININDCGEVHGLEKMENLISFNAAFNSRVQDPECQCHPRTRETVLAQMRDWIDNPDANEPIFWLCGPAGAGKSAIARTLARSCGRPKVVASFFFCRSDPTRNDGNLLFTTLAYQLTISIPDIKKFVAKSLDERPDLSTTDFETQFEELIVRPLQTLDTAALPVPAIVIIDGVDECTDEKLQRRFLKLICTTVRINLIPLRFIISSRREPHIEDTINDTRCSKVCLDLSAFEADSDIEVYFTDEFFRIASSQGLDPEVWPGSDKIGELVCRASGQFAYASLVIRYVGDEDCSAEIQLDIILGLRPPTTTSPFRELDDLYLGILQRHPDQAFLTAFLTLFVFYSWWNPAALNKDGSVLMKITEKEFRIKLRRMCSLFRLEPYIDVHHQSFLEFLQDPSRSGRYHAKEATARRYLELITESLVHYGSSVIENLSHNIHDGSHFCPEFGVAIHANPLKFVLGVEGWHEVLEPLLVVWDKLLDLPANLSPGSDLLSCDECTGFRIIRYLVFNVMFLEEISDHIVSCPTSNMQRTSCSITFLPPLGVIDAGGNPLEKGLNGCLASMLAHHRQPQVELFTLADLLLQLIYFDPPDTAKNVRSVSDALTVVNIIDRLTTGDYFLSQYGPDATRRAFQLALEIYARVPILPQSLLCNIYPTGFIGTLPPFIHRDLHIYSDHCKYWDFFILSNIVVWATPFTDTSRILGRNCIIPALWIYDDVRHPSFSTRIGGTLNIYTNSCLQPSWLKRLSFILNLAKLFQNYHSGDIVLHHEIDPVSEFQHLNSRVKICFWAVATSYVKETPHLDDNDKARLTFEANVFIFGCLFYCLFFEADRPFDDRVLYDGDVVQYLPLETEMDKEAWQIIQRCCAQDPKNRPTMDEVTQEINVLIEDLETTAMTATGSITP